MMWVEIRSWIGRSGLRGWKLSLGISLDVVEAKFFEDFFGRFLFYLIESAVLVG